MCFNRMIASTYMLVLLAPHRLASRKIGKMRMTNSKLRIKMREISTKASTEGKESREIEITIALTSNNQFMAVTKMIIMNAMLRGVIARKLGVSATISLSLKRVVTKTELFLNTKAARTKTKTE